MKTFLLIVLNAVRLKLMPVQIGQMLIITLESLLKVYASIKSIPNYSVEDYVRLEKKNGFRRASFCDVLYDL